MVAVAQPDGPETGWSAIRPVLVTFLLVADVFAVASLAIVQPEGWLPPFLAFGVVLVGLVWFQGWAIRHRHDDE
jgi:K+ transporter